VKTISDKVVWHLLAYLSVHKRLVGAYPSVRKFGKYWATPFQNADFLSIFTPTISEE